MIGSYQWWRRWFRLRKLIHEARDREVSRVLDEPVEDEKQSIPNLEELEKAFEGHDQQMPVLIPLLLILLIAAFLASSLILKTDEFDVVLSLDCSEVVLQPVGELVFPALLDAKSLHLGGLQQVRFRDRVEQTPRAVLQAEPGGRLAVQAWKVADDRPVHLAIRSGHETWRARPSPELRELRISMLGPVHVDPPSFGSLSLDRPTPFSAEPADDDLRVSWERQPSSEPLQFDPPTIRGLQVLFERPTRVGTRISSGILSGELIIEDLAGEKTELTVGEALKLEGVDGELTQLSSDGEKIRLRFVGKLSDARLGYSQLRSLRPSYFDVLLHHPALGVLRSLILTLSSILAFLWAWLRR